VIQLRWDFNNNNFGSKYYVQIYDSSGDALCPVTTCSILDADSSDGVVSYVNWFGLSVGTRNHSMWLDDMTIDVESRNDALYSNFHADTQTYLVYNGEAQYRLTCSDATWTDTDPTVHGFAAYELREYIYDITGVYLPTSGTLPEIKIGDDASPDSWTQTIKDNMDSHGYRIAKSGSSILIAGNNDDGTANGLYAFIDKGLGVRWLSGIPEITHVPLSDFLAIGAIDIVEAPDIKGHTYAPGINTQTGLTEGDLDDYFLWYRRNRLGGKIYPCSHNYSVALNTNTYASSNPEFYSYVNGARVNPFTADWQICHSDVDAAAEVAKWANAQSSTVRQTDFGPTMENHVFVTANDNHVWCECTPCANLGTTTDQAIYMLENVATDVEDSHPGRTIAFYAYSDLDVPPSDTSTALESNLMPVIARYGYTGTKAYNDTGNTSGFDDVVTDWAGISTQWGIREYYTFVPVVPWPNARVLAENCEWLATQGCEYINAELLGMTPMDNIAWYMAAKKSFNSDLDIEDLLDDYFDKYYGPASANMKLWFETAATAFSASAYAGDYDALKDDVYTSTVRDTMHSKIDAAKLQATASPYKERVEAAEISLDILDAWVEMDDAKDTLYDDWTDTNYNTLSDAYDTYMALIESPGADTVISVTAIKASYLWMIEQSLFGGTTFEVPEVDYAEPMNGGGNSQRDAISITNFTSGASGLYLAGKTSGEITYEFNVVDGLYADDIVVTFYFNYLLGGSGTNALKISVNDGDTWTTIMSNTDCQGSQYSLPQVEGYSTFLLKSETYNDDSVSRLALANFYIQGNAVYDTGIPAPVKYSSFVDDMEDYPVDNQYVALTDWQIYSGGTPLVSSSTTLSGVRSLVFDLTRDIIDFEPDFENRFVGIDMCYSAAFRSPRLDLARFGIQVGPSPNGRARIETLSGYFKYCDSGGWNIFQQVGGGDATTSNDTYYRIAITFHWNVIDYGTTYSCKIWDTNETFDPSDDTLYVDATNVPMLLEYEWTGIAPNYVNWFLLAGGLSNYDVYVDDISIAYVPGHPEIDDDMETYSAGTDYCTATDWDTFSTYGPPNVSTSTPLSGSKSLKFDKTTEYMQLNLDEADRFVGTDGSVSVCFRSARLDLADFQLQAGPDNTGRASVGALSGYFKYCDDTGWNIFQQVGGGDATTSNDTYYRIEVIFTWDDVEKNYGTTYDCKIWDTNETSDTSDDTLYVNATNVEMLLESDWATTGRVPNEIQWILLGGGQSGKDVYMDDLKINKVQ
jgi:Domain of unknown function (DUF4838)